MYKNFNNEVVTLKQLFLIRKRILHYSNHWATSVRADGTLN